ncbi:MAG: hypothetical protein KDD38_06810 [Bdellovibrionales bacterium]|nr:hypothetical protein [Bdellovibrionales bacterium]
MDTTNKPKSNRSVAVILISIFATIFGFATIIEGGTVLFTETGRQGAGHFVPFVLWFNFVAGFFYIIAGIMLFRLKGCARKLSLFIAMATIFVFMSFGVHILYGGAYEMRTAVAMTLRSSVWVFIALFTSRLDALKSYNCCVNK